MANCPDLPSTDGAVPGMLDFQFKTGIFPDEKEESVTRAVTVDSTTEKAESLLGCVPQSLS